MPHMTPYLAMILVGYAAFMGALAYGALVTAFSPRRPES